ncbi:MAG: alpha/beta fold hydrolase [Propionibacteriaceae bacterium]|nr:alpha/beta fold hydrolase [Propionibacteriaceae bacterium]
MSVLRHYWGTAGGAGRLAGVTLLCCPHAGGAASFFGTWRTSLHPSCRILAAQYPGREDRIGQRPAATLLELAREISAAALETVRAGSLVVLGHSMGALVAFETALQLADRGVQPELLVVSALAPQVEPRLLTARSGDPAGSGQLLTQLLQLDPEFEKVAAYPELADFAVRIVSADLDMMSGHRLSQRPLGATPILTLAGTDDPAVNPAELRAWRSRTTGAFSQSEFPGRHFYLRGDGAGPLAAVERALEAARRNAEGISKTDKAQHLIRYRTTSRHHVPFPR